MPLNRALFVLLLGTSLTLLLSACEFRKNLPSCPDFLMEKAQNRFQISNDSPIAYDTSTKIKWYRCNAGQVFIDGNCSGEPLELNWLDAQSFAREFSESSGKTWKVARYWQLRELQRKDCINPALDTRVFPDIKLVTTGVEMVIFLEKVLPVRFTLIKVKVTAGKERKLNYRSYLSPTKKLNRLHS